MEQFVGATSAFLFGKSIHFAPCALKAVEELARAASAAGHHGEADPRLREALELQGAGDAVRAAGAAGLSGELAVSVAMSLVFSAALETLDEWDCLRYSVHGIHVLVAARENDLLAPLLRPLLEAEEDGGASQDEAAEAAQMASMLDALAKSTGPADPSAAPGEAPSTRASSCLSLAGRAAAALLAQEGFPPRAGSRGGATPRELQAAEHRLGFPLPRALRVLLRARNGIDIPHAELSTLQLMCAEFGASSVHTSFFRRVPCVPVRNPVAGGRWGECWDTWLAGPHDLDAIVQFEFFFPPGEDEFGSLPARVEAQRLAAVERAAAAGAFASDVPWWEVQLEPFERPSDVRCVADALPGKERMAQLFQAFAAGLEGEAGYVASRLGGSENVGAGQETACSCL